MDRRNGKAIVDFYKNVFTSDNDGTTSSASYNIEFNANR
ncbi:hypothetical protein X842_3006 [Listeria monocytogenes Lm_1880]|nr:hypothetical protein X842_3006 [Listeria monocytogenes Lm_1880]